MAIEMGKKYRTRDGRNVRILCVDRAHEHFPVLGFIGPNDDLVEGWTKNGSVSRSGMENGSDLIEVSLYSDIEIDAPGWARFGAETDWVPAHFAGVVQGRPTAWKLGKTSHTAGGNYTLWGEFTTTKPEGL